MSLPWATGAAGVPAWHDTCVTHDRRMSGSSPSLGRLSVPLPVEPPAIPGGSTLSPAGRARSGTAAGRVLPYPAAHDRIRLSSRSPACFAAVVPWFGLPARGGEQAVVLPRSRAALTTAA